MNALQLCVVLRRATYSHTERAFIGLALIALHPVSVCLAVLIHGPAVIEVRINRMLACAFGKPARYAFSDAASDATKRKYSCI